MHIATTFMTLIASAAVSSAATVTFWTLDNQVRTIYFTPDASSTQIASVVVSNQLNTTVEFPDQWNGNYYAIKKGDKNRPGMLGEVQFSGWQGMTYFDVSAIVDSTDGDNVKQMWPKDRQSPMSGCEVFPCNNAYQLPDDVQTKVTDEKHLITTLGSGSTGIAFAVQQ